MYCCECKEEIAKGSDYVKFSSNNFCSLDCLTDHLAYSGRLQFLTNDGYSDEEDEDDEEEEENDDDE